MCCYLQGNPSLIPGCQAVRSDHGLPCTLINSSVHDIQPENWYPFHKQVRFFNFIRFLLTNLIFFWRSDCYIALILCLSVSFFLQVMILRAEQNSQVFYFRFQLKPIRQYKNEWLSLIINNHNFTTKEEYIFLYRDIIYKRGDAASLIISFPITRKNSE